MEAKDDAAIKAVQDRDWEALKKLQAEYPYPPGPFGPTKEEKRRMEEEDFGCDDV